MMIQERVPNAGEGQTAETEKHTGYGHVVVVPIRDRTSMQPLMDLAPPWLVLITAAFLLCSLPWAVI